MALLGLSEGSYQLSVTPGRYKPHCCVCRGKNFEVGKTWISTPVLSLPLKDGLSSLRLSMSNENNDPTYFPGDCWRIKWDSNVQIAWDITCAQMLNPQTRHNIKSPQFRWGVQETHKINLFQTQLWPRLCISSQPYFWGQLTPNTHLFRYDSILTIPPKFLLQQEKIKGLILLRPTPDSKILCGSRQGKTTRVLGLRT